MEQHLGKLLGNYRLLRLLGQGGFAEVYLGEHQYLKTLSAIKVLQTKMSNTEERTQFLTEAQVVAHLSHPHIIRVIDFGVEQAMPFIVMDYAPNGTLRQHYPRGSRLSISTILPFVRQIADALQYAHDERLIHRDMKPENLLLGKRNELLLSDFGLVTTAHSSRSQQTHDVTGTAAYMAPEQIQGKPRPESDQYALGIIVYEWLSGVCPFQGSFVEMCAQHMFATPPQLSARGVPLLSPQVEQVVMKSLAKDYHQRFESVKAFSLALEDACQSMYRSMQTENMPGIVSAPSSTPLSTIPFESPYAQNIASNRDASYGRAIQSTRLYSSDTTASAVNTSMRTPRSISRRRALISIVTVGAISGGLLGLFQLERQHMAFTQQYPPSNSSLLSVSPTPSLPFTYRGHQDKVYDVQWSPKGGRIASSSRGSVQLWNATDGSDVFTYTGQTADIYAIAWSPNGSFIVSVNDADPTPGSANGEGMMQIWNAVTGQNTVTYHGTDGWGVAWSPNGRYVAWTDYIYAQHALVRIWDVVHKKYLFEHIANQGDSVTRIAWSPNSQLLASSNGNDINIWRVVDQSPVYTYSGNSSFINKIAWSPDGKLMASANGGFGDAVGTDTVQVWNAVSGQTILSYKGHQALVEALAWSPDGKRIISGRSDGAIQVWEATTGSNVINYSGHTSGVNAVTWSPDGKIAASASDDMTVQVWDPSAGSL